MNPEHTIAHQLRDLGRLHADMAEKSDELTRQFRELLALGNKANVDNPSLESDMWDIVQKHETAVEYHGDNARFFFGMAKLIQSGEWRYSDLKHIHEMMGNSSAV